MKPVDQIYWGEGANGDLGDCFRACVASLLGRPTKDVPHFFTSGMTNEEGWAQFRNWVDERGMAVIGLRFRCTVLQLAQICSDVPCLVGMGDFFSKDDNDRHCVIFQAGKLVHDPNPTTAPDWFYGAIAWVVWIVPKAPYFDFDPEAVRAERVKRVAHAAEEVWREYVGANLKPDTSIHFQECVTPQPVPDSQGDVSTGEGNGQGDQGVPNLSPGTPPVGVSPGPADS